MELSRPRKPTLSVADIPWALVAPGRVFEKVENVPAYGWSLVLLLVMVTLVGYATVETGLVDRKVDRDVQASIASLEKEQLDVVERSALSKMIEEKLQEGDFARLMGRIVAVVVRPIAALAVVLLVPALFYAVVALTGKKPEWHTLVSIAVLASFADVVGLTVRLAFMLQFRTLEVDTSAALLTRLLDAESVGAAGIAAASGLLSAVDPFRIWFWIVVIVGLRATSQLRGWTVWATCSFFWLTAAGVRTLILLAGAIGAGKPV